MEETFLIHDNGGRPFQVKIHNNHSDNAKKSVEIYKANVNDEKDETYETYETHQTYECKPSIILMAEKVFIGVSPKTPLTMYGRGYGKDFDGNSILLRIKPLEYVFIGESIFSFQSKFPIEKYVSEVGNNDVPYPYAVDDRGNHYVMGEKVIITKPIPTDDVIAWYYKVITMSPDQRFDESTTDFLKLYDGNERYTMRFTPHPAKAFNRFKNVVSVVTKESYPKKIVIDKKEYVKIMKSYAKLHGIKALRTKVLIPRMW